MALVGATPSELVTRGRVRRFTAILCALSHEFFQSEVSLDVDPRWTDNPRDRDNYGLRAEALAKAGRELSQGSRGGLSNPREREPLDGLVFGVLPLQER